MMYMSAERRKKVRRLRGSRTHGWGHPKKHRGKGSRGGVGKSGMGKRGQHKMSLLNSLGIKNIGAHGFKRPQEVIATVVAINLRDVEARIDKWVKKGLASEEKGIIIVDMDKIGVTKVLGAGRVGRKIHIKADRISASAKEKIEKAGGRAEAMIVEVEEEAEPKAQEKKNDAPKPAAKSAPKSEKPAAKQAKK